MHRHIVTGAISSSAGSFLVHSRRPDLSISSKRLATVVTEARWPESINRREPGADGGID